MSDDTTRAADDADPPGRSTVCAWPDCDRKPNKSGYCFAHMQKGRAQEKEREPKTAPKATAAPGPSRPRAGTGLEKELREAYLMLAGGLTFADSDLGEWTAQRAERMAHAHAELARSNANVERFLRRMIEGGAATYALMETGLWAFGCYSIAMLKSGKLSQKQANAAVMFGVPLVPIVERLRHEPEPPDAEAA